jgi:ABC-type Fe3+-hydroxamate transport system substrate-binding protein
MIIAQGNLNQFRGINEHHKIISLVPSISWFVFDLHLQDRIKGITKFCKAALDQHKSYFTIGGTKNPDIKKIHKIKPDLILANKEENRKEDIEELAKDYPIYLSDVYDLQSMYVMMHEIGLLTGKEVQAEDYIQQIKCRHHQFQSENIYKNELTVAYLIWKDPYMTVGSDTFIHYMLKLAGFRNCYETFNRYPEIRKEDLLHRKPMWVLLSSEPYPFGQKHLSEFIPLKARLVDGRMFSWYGTFILQSFDYLDAFKKSLNNTA